MTDENEILKDLGRQARNELADTDLPLDIKGFDPLLAERISRRLGEDSVAADDGLPSTTGGDPSAGWIKKMVQAPYVTLLRRTNSRRAISRARLLACGTGVALAASLALVLLGEASRHVGQLSPTNVVGLSSPRISSEKPGAEPLPAAVIMVGAGSTSAEVSAPAAPFIIPPIEPQRERSKVTFGDDISAPKWSRSNDERAPKFVGIPVRRAAHLGVMDEAPDGGRPMTQVEASSTAQSSRSTLASPVIVPAGRAPEALFE